MNDSAWVTMPDGQQVEVSIIREAHCRTHGGVPGWGCHSCRDLVVKITGFKPMGGAFEW